MTQFSAPFFSVLVYGGVALCALGCLLLAVAVIRDRKDRRLW